MCGDGGTLAIGEAILDVRPKVMIFTPFFVGLSVMTFRGDQVFFVQVEYTVIQGCQGTLKLWFWFFFSFPGFGEIMALFKKGMVK